MYQQTNDHSGIHAHSMGELFPCIIARVERYPHGATAASAAPSVSWELTAYGRSEEYASYGDAEMVARALNSNAVTRAAWQGRPIDAVAPREARGMGGFGDANSGRSQDKGGRHA